MARKFNGTSDGGIISSMGFAGTPSVFAVTMAMWLWLDNLTDSRMIVEQGSVIPPGFDVAANTPAGNIFVRNYGTSGSIADTYVSPAAGSWHHHAWRITLGQPNIAWLDGSRVTLTSAGHGTVVGANYSNDVMSFACRDTSGTKSLFLAGRMAEYAMWTGDGANAPQDAHIAMLALGYPPPYVFPEGLVYYAPFFGDSPEPDYSIGHRAMTMTGATSADHPSVNTLLRPGCGRSR